MPLAVVASRALLGLEAPPVQVEVHLSGGLPAFGIVGLPEAEVREARERVRSALLNSSLPFPAARRIVVNLAPADLPKESGRFDLPIALGLLAAQGAIDPARLAGHEFAGELSLSGELRPVRGALAMLYAAQAGGSEQSPGQAPWAPASEAPPPRVPGLGSGGRRFVLPHASALEAAVAGAGPAGQLLGARHLNDVVAYLCGTADADSLRVPAPATPRRPRGSAPELADVRGQAPARRALEVAAAGAHHLLLVGPPGSGKTMLAQRLWGLLPALDPEQALQSAALLSLDGGFEPEAWARRSLRSPHHGSSAASLLGSLAAGRLRPGEVSLAHHGLLFLDELPEFDRRALEGWREPLESGCVHLARAARRLRLPARFQLVAAMNPCPCGHLGDTTRECRCTPEQVQRYRARLSGPLLDRIDLRVELSALAPAELFELPPGEPSALVAERVLRATACQRERQGLPNARLEASALEQHCALPGAERRWLAEALARLGASARSAHRVLRVARTIADLAGSPRIARTHLAEALQLRRALGGA